MLTVNSISPSFQLQPRVSSGKLAQQKAGNFLDVSKEVAQKAVEKVNTPSNNEAFLSNIQLINSVACIAKQAPKEYAVTSQKFAEQKGARLFQEI